MRITIHQHRHKSLAGSGPFSVASHARTDLGIKFADLISTGGSIFSQRHCPRVFGSDLTLRTDAHRSPGMDLGLPKCATQYSPTTQAIYFENAAPPGDSAREGEATGGRGRSRRRRRWDRRLQPHGKRCALRNLAAISAPGIGSASDSRPAKSTPRSDRSLHVSKRFANTVLIGDRISSNKPVLHWGPRRCRRG